MIELKRIGSHDLPLPAYGTDGAAGLDLSCVDGFTLHPGQRAMVATGFAWHIWPGLVGMIRPRSGLAVKYGIDVLAGVIDSDYRGEVRAVLVNHGDRPATFEAGDRVAQMVISEYNRLAPCEVKELADTVRGDGGFGSTGVGNAPKQP